MFWRFFVTILGLYMIVGGQQNEENTKQLVAEGFQQVSEKAMQFCVENKEKCAIGAQWIGENISANIAKGENVSDGKSKSTANVNKIKTDLPLPPQRPSASIAVSNLKVGA